MKSRFDALLTTLRVIGIGIVFVLVSSASAEVISIENPNKGFLNNDPTLTFYWQGSNSKGLIFLLPGGNGMINLSPEMTDLKFHFFQTLKKLTDKTQTSGVYDVVIMDSPYSLQVKSDGFAGPRTTKDHLIRIESVINYYRDKTKLPVILMGHSNGTISIREFLYYTKKYNKLNLVNGLILSGSRNEIEFESPINTPIIFLHNKQDGCINTAYSHAQSSYDKISKINKSRTSFITIESGSPQDNPCTSGYHMMFNAGEEVAKKLDKELGRIQLDN